MRGDAVKHFKPGPPRGRSCHFCWPSFGSGLRHPDLALAPHIALGTPSLPRGEKTGAYKPVLSLGLPLASPVARHVTCLRPFTLRKFSVTV